MDVDPTQDLRQAPSHRVRYACGAFGLISGLAGLAIALAQPHIAEGLKAPEPPPQRLSETLVEAGDQLVSRMVDRVTGKKSEPAMTPPVPPPVTPWAWYLSIAATALGFIGAVSGVVGWVRIENPRLAASAVAVGSLAIALVYLPGAAFVIALIIVVLLFLA